MCIPVACLQNPHLEHRNETCSTASEGAAILGSSWLHDSAVGAKKQADKKEK